MVISAKYVNWFDEELHLFYGHENDGLTHGIYTFGEDDDCFPIDVSWFKTEAEARAALLVV
jgi:hypothetical protein